MTTFVDDNSISLTPLVNRARANKELMLAYNINQSMRSSRNRKLRSKGFKKQSGKTTRANKTLIRKNNNIEKKNTKKNKNKTN